MPTMPRSTKGKGKPKRKRARKVRTGPKGPRGKPNAGSLTAIVVEVAEQGAPTILVDGVVKDRGPLPVTVAGLRTIAERVAGKPITLSLIYKARRFMSRKTLRRLFPNNR